MAVNLDKLKNIIARRPRKLELNVSNVFLSPEVGFRLLHNHMLKELKVMVIGARHLPNLYGFNRVLGYIIKVKIFPGLEKFETELRSESWPIYNQEFTFHLDSKNDIDQQISGKFLVLTAYAILENNEETASDHSSEYTNENFVSKFQRNIANLFDKKTVVGNETKGNEKLTPTKSTKSESPNKKKHENFMTFEKRRTIGSVTFSIQNSQFTKSASNFSKTTDDIWKNLENMRITTPSPNTEAVTPKPLPSKKGEVEICLMYKKSDDGVKCSFVFALSRMRCSLQIMQQHEHLNGLLYIKMKILCNDKVIAKGKTVPFPPSISQKFDTTCSNIKAEDFISNLEHISFHALLMTKNKLGKKHEIGNIRLSCHNKGSYLIHWEKVIENPNQNIIMWQPLLD